MEYLILNNKTVYFKKFKNLRTYSIVGGQIKKLVCKDNENFKFNIIYSIPMSPLPNSKIIKIKIKTKESEESTKIVSCKILPKDQKYSITCTGEDKECPQDIILFDGSIIPNPNNELFPPNSVFFIDFNRKRTVTIRVEKINKGKCLNYDNGIQKYNFTIINNSPISSIEKDFDFNF